MHTRNAVIQQPGYFIQAAEWVATGGRIDELSKIGAPFKFHKKWNPPER
jgi:hypothetical protein